MWHFFTTRENFLWAWVGGITILASIWATVQIDVQINKIFGSLYDTLQKALTKPNAVTEAEFYAPFFEFAGYAALYVVLAVLFNGFLVNHYCFRWRKSITEYYHQNWEKAHMIEGASQRCQEDCYRASRLFSSLGISMIESILTLIAFIPILWELSANVKYIPLIGEIDRGLMWACLMMAIIGTGLLSLVGAKLPGIEFNIQKEEAAYRKQLVKAEDDLEEINYQKFESLFENVKKIHYFSFLHYMYFSISKLSFLQGMVIFPYLIMGPTIISAGITLGVVSQTVRAFGKVSESMQYIIRGWLEIVELISVYKRLRGFEKKFLENRQVANV